MKKNFSQFKRIAATVLALMLILSAVSAGFVSAETTTPTYEVMGEEIAYDLANGLVAQGDTLENGAAIITNSTADRKTITLAENLQDFKISFKYCNGNITDTSGNIEPVLITMRGKYYFANPKYNVAAGDIYFAGGSEESLRINGGGSTGWHSIEITMKGNKAVIIYDGARWYETELIDGATSGALSVALKYADTKIADLKVETPTDYDAARVINADFSTAKNTTFTVKGEFNADESALAVTAKQTSYYLGSSDAYNSVYNYTLESTFKLDGVTTNAYQRGVIFNLPSGNAVALFTDKIRTASSNDYLYNKDYFNEFAASIQDGNYHTVRIESVNDTESLFVDDVRIYTFEDIVRAEGKVKYQNAIQDGTVYLKNIVLTEYVAPVVEGSPTYEVFGETKNYDLSSGLVFDGDTLENGSGIITNITNDDRVIELDSDVQDFKLSYKFKNGLQVAGDEYTIWAPVMARMRETDEGAYAFAGAFWQYNDITFLYHHGGKDVSESHRDQYGGESSVDSTNKWHTVEIMVKGDRAVILYDGVRWHDGTLARGTESGKLSIRLRYANTKIADLKVEEITDEDMARVIDLDFETRANAKYNMWHNSNGSAVSATHNADEGALVVTNLWDRYAFSAWNWATDVTAVDNYMLETTIRLDGITTTPSQRGVILRLPSGNAVGIFGTQFRTADGEHITGYGSDYFTYRSADLMDGNYHTVKVISKYGYEQVICDGVLLKTFEVTERTSNTLVWQNVKAEGTTYIKSIKMTDITALDVRQLYAEKEIDVSSKNASNRVITRNHGVEINGNAWVFSTSFMVKDIDAHKNNDLIWFRFKTTDSGNNNSVGLCITKSQYYMQGSNYGMKYITDDNGYVPHTIGSNQWVDVEVIIVDDYAIVTIDGVKNVWKATNGIPVDSKTSDHIQFFPNANDTVDVAENIVFKNTKYEYVTVLGAVTTAIDDIGEVTADSGSAIIDAEELAATLGKTELEDIAYFVEKLAAAYDAYDALFDDGDVTEDGTTNIIDLIRLKKISAGAAKRTVKANVDKGAEHIVTASDAVAMRTILLG